MEMLRKTLKMISDFKNKHYVSINIGFIDDVMLLKMIWLGDNLQRMCHEYCLLLKEEDMFFAELEHALNDIFEIELIKHGNRTKEALEDVKD